MPSLHLENPFFKYCTGLWHQQRFGACGLGPSRRGWKLAVKKIKKYNVGNDWSLPRTCMVFGGRVDVMGRSLDALNVENGRVEYFEI